MHEADTSLPDRMPLRTALILAALFAALTFLIHLLTTLRGLQLGYGFFRDELYYLVCGRHLAWGYVDQPPLVALQARLAETLFGLSPTGIRILSFAAGGLTVGLTGLLTWQLGGRRAAQVLAMTAVLAAPVFLATADFLSMNSFEPCFWMGSMLVLLRIADGSAGPRAWLIFGLLAGLGIENKHSTAFFLAALLIGLLLSPQRRLLWSKGCAAGVALLILLALPNFIWQWVHHFPTYELLNNIAHSDKNIKLSPLAFLGAQINILLVFSAPLWIAGLAWLAFARKTRPWRFVALTYLVFLVMMMALHAKHYYVAPLYPVLFAGGSVALGMFTRRAWPSVAYTAILATTLVFIAAPLVLTILPPDKYKAYTVHFLDKDAKSEKFSSPLPQLLSDRFGWPQMVEGFASRYYALPPDVRAHTAIFCRNYGEASAVNILGDKYGLPTAISGHQNYFYWGWNGYTGESVLTLGEKREDYTDSYAEVIDLGPFDAPWIMDFEHLHYFWLRHRKRPYAADWPEFKFWY
ncbi:MAG: glycosyltransferase family 39 protein [Terracidiphilus sp.]